MRIAILLLTFLSGLEAQVLGGIVADTHPAGGGGGSIAIVNSATSTSGSASLSGTFTVALSMTAGNTALIFTGFFNQLNSPTSVKLSNGTSCTQDGGGRDDTAVNSLWAYRCTNVPSGITGVDVVVSGAGFLGVSVVQVSGLNASPLNFTSGTPHNQTNTTWVSETVSPTAGLSEIIIGGVYNAGGLALVADSNYPIASQSTGTITMGVATRIVPSTTGTYTVTGTYSAGNSSASAVLGMAYKQ